MNAPLYVELLPAFALSALDLAFATLLHRVVVRDADLVRRRQFFESLSVAAFLVALLLVITSLLLWRAHPGFVILCSVVWAAFCLAVLAASRLRHRFAGDDDYLGVPEMWADAVDSRLPARAALPPPRPALPRSPSPDRLGVVDPMAEPPPGSASTHLRSRLTESDADAERRLRGNLAVYRRRTGAAGARSRVARRVARLQAARTNHG